MTSFCYTASRGRPKSKLVLPHDDIKYRILTKLFLCRGYRAYGISLLNTFPDCLRDLMHVHNVCVVLFRFGLLEKQRGMYSLTDAAVAFLRSGSGVFVRSVGGV
ncbi:hypothetical protein QN372_00745 [Undibacterium sp. RTI2.1]|uniref:hypothetical protein n=1 Tax=unclassified Undibacterium TaxID=2630295 RepID=UPI002AB47EFB|nr:MULTISPECIES: hypothetical protein [unclassified Undibacterium]MDY7537664.1 hypothetical protein [Undibacterium sp. 5I1]MEB0029266.1 hypothetical protein [Undibacterium sp. RTI2.1]MEB0115574.1 hypothetical protein [Undibacterium sp. RTI2.2]MEB0256401.1 hypothetical protein [Undibacterium sp. 5I1]